MGLNIDFDLLETVRGQTAIALLRSHAFSTIKPYQQAGNWILRRRKHSVERYQAPPGLKIRYAVAIKARASASSR